MKRNTIIDEEIKNSRKALKQGASLEHIQQELMNKLNKLKDILDMTAEEEARYTKEIMSLGKENHILYANRKAIAMISLTGTLLITSAAMFGCGNKENSVVENKEVTEQQTEDEVLDEVTIDYVLPAHLSFDANDMQVASTNLSAFINDALAKGLGTVKKDGKLVSTFNENNLSKKVESYFNWYLVANINKIDYKVLAQLNQQGNLTADMLYQDFINVTAEIKEDTYSSKEDLLLENIFADKNDSMYINKLTDLIHRINKSDSKSNKDLIKEAKEIKEGMLVNFANLGTEINAAAADYALTQLEIADALLNGKVITNDEDEKQLYNSAFKNCVEVKVKEELGVTEVNGLVSSEVSLKSVFRNQYRMQIVDKMNMSLAYDADSDLTTSYNYVVKNISDAINLENFVANEYTASEWLWLKTSDMTLDELKDIQSGKKEVVSETPAQNNINKNDVPKENRIPDKVTIKDKETGKKASATYVKAKKAAIEAASADVAKEYARLGSSLNISTKSVPSKPSVTSENYNEVYSYWYAKEWNSTLKDFQKKEKEYKDKIVEENYEEIDETIIDNGSTNPTDGSNDNSNDDEYFEEIDPIVIDTGIIGGNSIKNPIDELKALKASLQSMIEEETNTLITKHVR